MYALIRQSKEPMELGGARRIPVLGGMFVALAALPFVVLAAAQVSSQSPSEQLREALFARSDDWDSEAVDELVSAIVAMQGELGTTFSRQQIKDIAQGLRDPTWEKHAADWMHPIVRRRNILRLEHGVRQYLLRGRVDPEQRARGLKMLERWVAERRDLLTAKYMEQANVIADAEGEVLRRIASKCRNPLRTAYALPPSEDIIEKANKDWQELYSRFDMSRDLSPDERFQKFLTLLLRGVSPLLSVPESDESLPPELKAAEADIERNLSEISEWQRLAIHRRIEERERQTELAALLAEFEELRPDDVLGGVVPEDISVQSADGPLVREGFAAGGTMPVASQNNESPRPEPVTYSDRGEARGGDSGVTLQGGVVYTAVVIGSAGVLVAVTILLVIRRHFCRRRDKHLGKSDSVQG